MKTTSHYPGGGTDSVEASVLFVPPTIVPRSLPTSLSVTIPDPTVNLGTRLYTIPGDLTYFDDSYFPVTTRATIEYILSVAAWIQDDFT